VQVEVGRGVWIQGIDIDGAPVGERHAGRWGGEVGGWVDGRGSEGGSEQKHEKRFGELVVNEKMGCFDPRAWIGMCGVVGWVQGWNKL
jgi:hypothetical protein